MKGVTLLSATALILTAVRASFAHGFVPFPLAMDDSVKPLLQDTPVQYLDLRGDFQPASLPDPYIYLQTQVDQRADTGGATRIFASFSGGRLIGDDVVLYGGAAVPPTQGFSTTDTVAALSEISFAIAGVNFLSNPSQPGTLRLNIAIYPWNGLSTAAAVSPAIATGTATLNFAANTSSVTTLVTLSTQTPISVPKAFWVVFEPDQQNSVNINLANIGVLVSNSTPGSVALTPGRGYYRVANAGTAFTTVTSNSIITTLPQASLYLAIRGRYNFIGGLDLSGITDRARPKDPLRFDFDADGDGIKEAQRRNLVDVELFNDQANPPFTTRFTTYLDENGRFTLPLPSSIASVTVRRWDNGLKVTFNRPDGGWSTSVLNPTTETRTVTFGDVNGDGVIDDADLLTVLFRFGSSE